MGLEPFTGAVVASRAATPLPTGQTRIKRPSFATFGPDGQLYLMDYGEAWGANGDSQLLKISYVSGNLPPVAKVQPDFLAVSDAPDAEKKLSAAESRDPDGGALTFNWTLQPGGKPLGTTAEIPVTIKEPGNYVAEVRVTDAQGASSTARTRLNVGNRAPKVTFLEPKDGATYTPGQPIKYRLAISDPEDGESSAKPDELGARTLVTGAFRRDDGKEEPLDPGITRMKQSDCFNCHAAEQKSSAHRSSRSPRNTAASPARWSCSRKKSAKAAAASGAPCRCSRTRSSPTTKSRSCSAGCSHSNPAKVAPPSCADSLAKSPRPTPANPSPAASSSKPPTPTWAAPRRAS